MNNSRSRFILAFTLLLSVTGSVSAILDLDNNGSSDIWEEHYNATLPADEDPDGDGFTNKQEYDRGTHPLVKDSSAESITIVPDGSDNYQSEFRFFGGIARSFMVEETIDLAEAPWSYVQDDQTGQAAVLPGADITVLMVESLNSNRKFFRLDPLGADPDAEPPGMEDNLDAVEEYLLGTDNTKADSDGDYLSDFVEASGATSAILFDSDGDGINDGQALGYGQYWVDGVGLDALAVFEAEVYVQRIDEDQDDWRSYLDGDASEGQALQSESAVAVRTDDYIGTAGSARYRVYFTEPGNYYAWVRGKDAGGGENDSVHMGLNDAVNQGVDQLGGFGGEYTWVSRSYDGHRAVYGIATAGWHTINLWIREPDVAIDQVLLTGDPEFVPDNRSYSSTTSGLDSDQDGLPDDWETQHGLMIGSDDGLSDSDGDQLTAFEERVRGLNPSSPDSDGDDMPDGYEVAKGFNPLDYYDALEDPDGDEYPNVYEHKHGKDPLIEGFVDDPDYPVAVPPAVWVVDKRGNGDFTTITSALAGIDGDSYEIVDLNEARNGLGPFDRYYLDSNGETFPLIIPAKTMIRGTTMEINSDGIIGTTIGSFNNNQNGQPYCILSDHSVLSQTSFQNTQNHDRSEPCILAENTTHIRISNSIINRYRNTGTDGGAIRLVNTRAIIFGSSMSGNTTLSTGGQIAAFGSTVFIRKCYLSHSVDSNPILLGQPLPQKGGLLYAENSTVKVESSSLTAGVARQGGCVHASNHSAVQLLNCRLMYAFGGTQVSGSIPARGGAMFIDETSSVQADHVSLHSHKDFSGSGTTAYVIGGGQLTMTNCIDWGNSGATAYEGEVTITFSNIQGGFAGEGNISIHPDWDSSSYFPEDTLALNAISPCIDMGKLLTHVLTDIDGDLRPNGALPDLGADETVNGSATDSDGDGLADVVENQLGTNASLADSDGDLLPDDWEIEHHFNPGIADTPLVTDSDGDGLSDWFEYRFRSDPRSTDTDTDEYSDFEEVMLGLNPVDPLDVQTAMLDLSGHTYLGRLRDGSPDSDGDTLSDQLETGYWLSNPQTDQTDADTMPDGWEVRFGLDPNADNTLTDADEDQISDLLEFQQGLDPGHWDTDGDGLPDQYEIDLGLNPRSGLAGLTAWWRMDREFEPMILDQAQRLHSGRIQGKVTFEERRSGQAAVFDGMEGYLSIPHHNNLDLTGDWTLCLWFWPDSNATNLEQVLLCKQDAYRLVYLTTTQQVRMEFGTLTSQMAYTSSDVLIPDQWNHLLIQWEETSENLVSSINDSPGTTWTFPAAAIHTSTWPLWIGSPRTVPSQTPLGKIDDVRLYGQILDTQDRFALAHPDDPSLEANQDVDGDGLLEYQEVLYDTERNLTDSDGDGIEDGDEIHLHGTHPNMPDTDGDELSDGDEITLHNTSPLLWDTDQDGLSDYAEINYHLTDPNDDDHDGDLIKDGDEVAHRLDPRDPNDAIQNNDNDFLNNKEEIDVGTNPNFDESTDLLTDTDGDGLSDYAETTHHLTDPSLEDTIGDGLGDRYRVRYGLIENGSIAGHPQWTADGDADGDGRSNATEKSDGTSPTDETNLTAALVGEPILITRSPVADNSEDEEPHTFIEETVVFPYQEGNLVFLSGAEDTFEALTVESEIVILDKNGSELGRLSPGEPMFDPGEHLGDSPLDVYTLADAPLLNEFLEGVEPDAEGNLTLTFKFEVKKIPFPEDPDEGTDTGSGIPGGGSGGALLTFGPPQKNDIPVDPQAHQANSGNSSGGPPKPDESKITFSSSRVYVSLFAIDMVEVISDQIAGNEANKLPTAFYVGEPNNPMLMATRSGQKAKLRVRMGSSHDLTYVGARKIGAQNILGSTQSSDGEIDLEFEVPAKSHDIYEVVAGADTNDNQQLDNDEVLAVFEKTPGGSGQYWDKIIVVDKDQFQDSVDWAISRGGFPGTAYAGDLLKTFGQGSNTVADAHREDQIAISSTEPGLSHPVGAKWNGANKDTTYRFVFDDGDPASEDVDNSNALRQIVEKMITTHKTAMLTVYTGTPEWLTSPYYDFDESKDLDTTEGGGLNLFNELGKAFGKVDFTGQVRFSYKRVGDNIQIGSTEVVGNFSDIYDFAYGGGDAARIASMAQAGHATLASGNHGKVFFTRLNFNSGWSDKWNGDY